MTRFRVPSSSTLSSVRSQQSMSNINSAGDSQRRTNGLAAVPEDRVPVAGPSTAAEAQVPPRKAQKQRIGRTRSVGKVDVRKKEAVRAAKKKAEVKATPKLEWSFVFVGNLSSSVTDEQLRELFEACGAIRSIQIRASSGICVPTANLQGGFLGLGGVQPGVHYATVSYFAPASARMALDLNGVELEGREIIVSFSALDLPETREVLLEHIAQKNGPPEKPAAWKELFGQVKRLTIQRTERVREDNAQSGGGRTKWLQSAAERLGLCDPAGASGGTAAGAHQKGARHALTRQSIFPRALN